MNSVSYQPGSTMDLYIMSIRFDDMIQQELLRIVFLPFFVVNPLGSHCRQKSH